MRPRTPLLLVILAGLCCLLTASSAHARDVRVTVPGTANPWLAAGPCCDYHGAGSRPVLVTIPEGTRGVQFKDVTGGVGNTGGEGDLAPPDGYPSHGSDISGVNGIGGYAGSTAMPLVAVFLGPRSPLEAPPRGSLGQVFLVGSGGSGRTFPVPAGARRLFLGIPDGYGFTGSPSYYEDNIGSFSATVVVLAPETKISGRVVDSFGEGVGNVEITADPPRGGAKRLITDDTGFFTFELAAPNDHGKFVVRARPRGDDRVEPRSVTVTVRRGKTSYARFAALTAIVQGNVRELLCPVPIVRENCSKRIPRAGAIVKIDGPGVREAKVTRTHGAGDPRGPPGSFSFKVPPGRYEVWVDRLDVGAEQGADLCHEDRRIPLIVDPLTSNARPVPCAAKLRDRRERVEVTVPKGKRATVDFVGVPRRYVSRVRFLTFPRGRAGTGEVQSGLAGKPEPPLLFGDLLEAGEYPTLQCRSGCAVIDARVRNLLGEPLRSIRGSLRAMPVDPPLGIGLEPTPLLGLGPSLATSTNIVGQACAVRTRARPVCFRGAPTDEDGRVLGLYLVPGLVSQQALPDARPDAPYRARVLFEVPAQQGYRSPGVSTATITIRPTQVTLGRSRLVLSQEQADFLNILTNPADVGNATRAGLRAAKGKCDTFKKAYLDKIPFPAFKAFKVFCSGIGKVSEVGDYVFEFFDQYAFTTALLYEFRVNPDGLFSGLGLKKIPTSKADLKKFRIGTKANSILRQWLLDFRAAQGDPTQVTVVNGELESVNRIRAGQTIVLEIFEVSRPHVRADLVIAPQPAVYLHLRTPDATVRATAVISNGYDPELWLRR